MGGGWSLDEVVAVVGAHERTVGAAFPHLGRADDGKLAGADVP
jgi:hypothetical protein